MKNQLYQIISILAISVSFLPIALVSIKKLWREPAFLLMGFYWMLSGLVNLTDKVPSISHKSLDMITMIYNMVDIPIILWILSYTTASRNLKKFTRISSPILFLLQLLLFIVYGWNFDAAKYVLAGGLLAVLIAVVWEISLYMQKLEHTKHENSMIFIYVSLLFAYGTFIIVYIFDYYINVNSSSVDNLIIYYISTLIAVLIAAIGYFSKASSRNFIR
ncbi:MAG: hypothetical protein ACKVOW_00290 [Chitinophagaceae bacterium]